MVKVTSKEISALERQRGSWEFFWEIRVVVNMEIKPNKFNIQNRNIDQKSDRSLMHWYEDDYILTPFLNVLFPDSFNHISYF